VTGVGRVCGVSASIAPRATTVETSSSCRIAMSSAQKPRQRMLGSMPRMRTTSRSLPGGRATEMRVVGHSIRRLTPPISDTVGRLTWKS
jgi:hypothetical protein